MMDQPKSIEDYRKTIKLLKLKIVQLQKRNQELEHQVYSTNPDVSVINYQQDTQSQSASQLFQELQRNCRGIGLTPEMLFRAADEYNTGAVTVDQFRVFLKKVKLSLTSSQCDRIAYMCDSSLNGMITRDSYYELLQVYGLNQEIIGQAQTFQQRALINYFKALNQKGLTPEKSFQTMDVRNQGFFEQNDFDNFAQSLKSNLSQNDIISLFNHFNVDRTGTIPRDFYLYELRKAFRLQNSGGLTIQQSTLKTQSVQQQRSPQPSAVQQQAVAMAGSSTNLMYQSNFQYQQSQQQLVRSETRKPVFAKNIISDKQFDQYIHSLCPQITDAHRFPRYELGNKNAGVRQTIFNDIYAALSYCSQIVQKLSPGQLWDDPEFGPTTEDPKGGFSMYFEPNKIVASKEEQSLDPELEGEAKQKRLEEITQQKRWVQPGQPNPKEDIEWLQPQVILDRKIAEGKNEYRDKNPQFISGGASSNDVLQSQYLGDCWFVSALTLIASDDNLLRGSFIPTREGQEIDDNQAKQMTSGVYPPLFHYLAKHGIYVLKFFKNFKWRFVVIDSKICCRKGTGEIIYGQCRDASELWVVMIEKAYAKLHNCYAALTSGDIAQGLADMTGMVADRTDMDSKILNDPKNKKEKEELWKQIRESKLSGTMLGCSAQGETEGNIVLDGANTGIMSGHAYGIIDSIEIPWNEEDKKTQSNYHMNHRLIRLKNPWGHGEWQLKWSENENYRSKIDSKMDFINDYYKEEAIRCIDSGLEAPEPYDPNVDDGTFWMSFKDWRTVFHNLFECINFPDEWSGRRVEDKWTQELSFGSPKASPDSKVDFCLKNPQYILEVDAQQPVTKVYIQLTQEDGRLYKDQVYPFEQTQQRMLLVVFRLDEGEHMLTSFDPSKIIASCKKLILRRQVDSDFVELKNGRYAVIPCTRFPVQNDQNFSLSFYWNCTYDQDYWETNANGDKICNLEIIEAEEEKAEKVPLIFKEILRKIANQVQI